MPQNKCRILILSPNGYLGGAERFVFNTATEHHRRLAGSVQVLFFNSGTCVDLCKQYRIPYSLLPFKVRLSRPFSFLKTVLHIAKLVQKDDINVIHSTMPYSQLFAAFVKLFNRKVKLVWYQHGPIGGWLDRVANWTWVDAIFFNSHYLQSVHNSFLGDPRHRKIQYVIPPGLPSVSLLDTLAVNSIRSTYRIEARELFIMPGRICRWKGQDTALRAIRILRERIPHLASECFFLIIGSANSQDDSTYESELLDFIQQNQLTNLVRMIPAVSDLQNYYRASAFTLHASHIPEPFGLVVAEAMQAGSVVIASDEGGMKDLVQNGITGFTYRSTRADSDIQLAEALSSVLRLKQKNPSEIDRVQKNAQQHILNKYSIETCVGQMQHIYNSLISF